MKTVRARWYTKGRIATIRLIVIHDMEWSEKATTAEDCAHMFATQTTQASAHICVDNDTAVRSVDDGDTAWAAPGGNADGLNLEMAGFMTQSRAMWLDNYGKAMMEVAAKVCADWANKYKIPVRKLTQTQLKNGLKGFTSHADISKVYRKSDHTDPGSGFPWDYFLARVLDLLDGSGTPAPDPVEHDKADAPEWPGRYLTVGSSGTDVSTWQRQMRARDWNIAVDGIYGEQSRNVCVEFQREESLDADGVVGPVTWDATWNNPLG